MSSDDRPDGPAPESPPSPRSRRAPTELLERVRRLATRGRRTVEEFAQRVLGRSAPAPADDQGDRAPQRLASAAGGRGVGHSPDIAPLPASPTPTPPPQAPAEPDVLFVGDLSPERLRALDEDVPELPDAYGDHRVVLVARDPQWLYCSWDISAEARAPYLARKARITLRLQDVTDLELDGHNAWSQHRYPLDEVAREWYVPAPSEGRSYLAEVGYELPDGRFLGLGRSGVTRALSGVPAPREEPVFAEADPDRPLEAPPPLPRAPAPPPSPPLSMRRVQAVSPAPEPAVPAPFPSSPRRRRRRPHGPHLDRLISRAPTAPNAPVETAPWSPEAAPWSPGAAPWSPGARTPDGGKP